MTRQFALDLNDHRGNVVALVCVFVLVHKLELPFWEITLRHDRAQSFESSSRVNVLHRLVNNNDIAQ